MANRQPTGDLRGLIEPLAELRTATITATSEAGPEPGGAAPERATRMQIVTSGALDSSLADIRMATSRGGTVGTAEVRWGLDGGDLYNYNPPVAISGFEFIDFSTTATKHTRPHACRLPDSGLVVAVSVDDSNTVTAWRQSASGLWSSATVATTSASSGAGTPDIAATVVATPEGRLICLYTAATSSGASSTQIKSATSDDGGATWTVTDSDGLASVLGKASSKYLRIRAAYLNGLVSVLLWEQDATDTIYQYVSADEGATLTLVETFAVADKACPDLIAYRGALHIVTVEYDASKSNSKAVGRFRRLASAALPLSGAAVVEMMADTTGNMEWGNYSGGIFAGAELAIVGDDGGDLWVYAVDFHASAKKEVFVRASTDGGDSWQQVGTSSHHALGVTPFWSGTTTDILRDICAIPHRGSVLLLSRSNASTATSDDSLLATRLGGWSDVGLPELAANARRTGAMGWDSVYVPIETPTNYGAPMWSASGGGSESLTSTGLSVTNALSARYFDSTLSLLAANKADGILALFVVSVASGTWRHLVRISDGTNDYTVTVDATSTGLDLRDLNTGGAGTSLATASITASRLTYILIALDKPSGAWSGANGRVRAWYRQENTGLLGPQPAVDWTQIGTSSSLTATTSTAGLVRFGMYSSGTGTAVYRFVAFTDGAYTCGNIGGGGTTRGRVLAGMDCPIHLTGGLRIAGRGGPTAVGDTWLVSTRYRYAVEHAGDPWRYPSPRQVWRSALDNSTVDIIWTGLDLGWRAGDLIALVLKGCNWQTATLYRDSTGTNKIADISLKAANVGFTRSRKTIIAAPGGSSDLPFYAHEDGLRGATIDLGGGDLRKIATNREGAWLKTGAVSGPGYVRVEADLETYDSGDAASGTADLWMPSAVFITEAMAATDTIMLRISSQATADGFYEIGTAMLGRVRLFGMQYSRGRAQISQPANEITETIAGGRTARLKAPSRRAWEVSWDDGIDTSGLNTVGKDPDYITLGYTNADALAAPPSTGATLAGIVRRIGASVPVVWLAGVKQLAAATTSSTPITLLEPASYLFGRVTNDEIRIDSNPSVRGDELRDPGEVVTVGRVTISEEV